MQQAGQGMQLAVLRWGVGGGGAWAVAAGGLGGGGWAAAVVGGRAALREGWRRAGEGV